jgi:two-component system phosphate regulon sensor histidine kinase PhoR
MTLLAFLLGLTIGIGFWLWQHTQLQRKLQHLLRTFQTDDWEISLPILPRLRRQISLQKQHHAELQDQLQIWQHLLQVAPLGYLQVDEENQLLWCNKQAQQLLGLQKWEPGQVRLLLELVRSYELDQLIEQTREQQQPKMREWVFHPPYANAATMVGLRSLTLRGESWPLPEGQVGVFLENRQPLVDLSQARDRWVSDLAHELRTPLTSIRLVVETLQEHLQPPMRRWVDRLVPEVDRLINLVQSWLELSQLEANPSKQLNRQPVEVRSLIHSVWQSLEPLAQLNQLNLTYSGPETVWIGADESRLYRVFLNLLHNSIKYSPPQGTIRVAVNILPEVPAGSRVDFVNLLASENAPKQLQINIIDSGPGFPHSDLPHVFERLYRGDSARARQPASLSNSFSSAVSTGSGLGLAIVRQIVLAHGGSVKAMNHPDTGGAWLQVELPDAMADFGN